MKVYQQYLENCLQCGIPAISTDKAAKILAMLYVLGGSHSSYTYSTNLRASLEYIKKRFHIDGGETPDASIIPLIKQYSQELETAYANADERSEVGLRTNWYPEWASKIAEEYNLPKNNSI